MTFAPFAALLTATALVASLPAQAAGPMQRKLQIDAELLRDASFTGTERGRTRLVQTVSVQVLLTTDGTPMPNNPLDPDDPRRQLERAQRTQQKVNAALAQQQQRPPVPQDPRAMAAMQAQAQAMMAKCGQDRECLMREATQFSAAQVAQGNPQVQGRLQAYGQAVQACERQHQAAAARDACIAKARRQAGGSDETDADDEVETPYLMFTGPAACQFDAALKIDERTEGSFDDVQGVVPFTTTVQAEGRDRDQRSCPVLQAVLDTRSGRLWTHVLPAVRGAQGLYVRSEKGRKPQRHEGEHNLRWHEAQDWLQARLSNLNAGGSDRLEQPLPGGKLALKLRWSFVPQ